MTNRPKDLMRTLYVDDGKFKPELYERGLFCGDPKRRVVQGGSLARFTNRKNSKSRITEMKISFSSSSRVMQNLQVTDYEE